VTRSRDSAFSGHDDDRHHRHGQPRDEPPGHEHHEHREEQDRGRRGERAGERATSAVEGQLDRVLTLLRVQKPELLRDVVSRDAPNGLSDGKWFGGGESLLGGGEPAPVGGAGDRLVQHAATLRELPRNLRQPAPVGPHREGKRPAGPGVEPGHGQGIRTIHALGDRKQLHGGGLLEPGFGVRGGARVLAKGADGVVDPLAEGGEGGGPVVRIAHGLAPLPLQRDYGSRDFGSGPGRVLGQISRLDRLAHKANPDDERDEGQRRARDEGDTQHAAADGSQVLQDGPFSALGPASIPTTFNLLSERFTGQRGSAIRRLALGDGRDNQPVTLDKLTQRLRDFAAARDWEPFHTPKNLVMALSGEVGELTALFQWLTPEEAQQWRSDPELEANVKDEIADVTLYLVRLADMLGVDLLEAANAKVDRNELRFPPLDRGTAG